MNSSLQPGVFLSNKVNNCQFAGQYANILNQSDISEFNMKKYSQWKLYKQLQH